jgi:hypothetical protein
MVLCRALQRYHSQETWGRHGRLILLPRVPAALAVRKPKASRGSRANVINGLSNLAPVADHFTTLSPSAVRVNQQSYQLEHEEARLGFCRHPVVQSNHEG